MPASEANFVWLRLGERTAEFAAACEAAGVVVRPFAGEGARVTIGEPEANDLFLEVAKGFVADCRAGIADPRHTRFRAARAR